MRRRLHGRHLRPAEEKLRRNIVGVEGMHRGGHRGDEGRPQAGFGFPSRAPRGRRQLVGFPGIPQKEGDRRAEALRDGRPPRDARSDREVIPVGEAAALPRPCPKEHLPSRQDPRREGNHGRFQKRLFQALEKGMRRGLRGIRVQMGQAVPEAGPVPGREAGLDVPLLRVPEADVEIDLHVQRGRIAQCHGEEEDKGQDTVQF